MVERLLSCPFCGDKAISGSTLDNSWYAMCVSETCWAMTGYLETEAEAIAAWNRRASPAPSQHTGWSDEAKLGKFDHHPDPAIDFEIEVESLQARLFDAKGGISKPGTEPEAVATVLADIERAMTFRVGGDPGAVSAKGFLRSLEDEARAALAASSIAPATGFEVKALSNWKHIPSLGVWSIGTPLGVSYWAWERDGRGFWCRFEHSNERMEVEGGLTGAKAACFADLNTRIRSSISLSVAKESGEP